MLFPVMLKRFAAFMAIIMIVWLLMYTVFVVKYSYSPNYPLAETQILPTVSTSNIRRLKNERVRHLLTQSSPLPTKNKYIVYSCTPGTMCGGYADREKGIVAAYLLANITKRVFKIELTTPCDIALFLKPAYEDWEIHSKDFKGLTTYKSHLLDGKGRSYRKHLISHDIRNELKADVFFVTLNSDFVHALLKSELYKRELEWAKKMQIYEVYRYVLDRLFTLTPKLQKRLNEFFVKVGKKKLVCAQIRIGRNPSNANDSPRNDINRLDEIWAFFSKYNDPDKYRLFLTTDAQQVRDEGSRRFPNLMLDTEGEIVHIERTQNKNMCNHQNKVVLDQEILARCDVSLVSNSGFGRIGAFRRGKDRNLYYWNNNQVSVVLMNSTDFMPTIW